VQLLKFIELYSVKNAGSELSFILIANVIPSKLRVFPVPWRKKIG
jgi:hypothetical protein